MYVRGVLSEHVVSSRVKIELIEMNKSSSFFFLFYEIRNNNNSDMLNIKVNRMITRE